MHLVVAMTTDCRKQLQCDVSNIEFGEIRQEIRYVQLFKTVNDQIKSRFNIFLRKDTNIKSLRAF